MTGKEKVYEKIPNNITVGGQKININTVDRCKNDNAGLCNLWAGYIEIANKFGENFEQSETSKINTFYHELIHCILDTMGERKLSSDEKFVCSFAGFLNEAMKNAYFKEDKE